YSITNGVGAGLISYVVIKFGRGKWREAGWLLTLLAAVFAVYFAVDGVKTLFG
ncbi:MAG TPA: NCS2 family permease, partial [Amycolatopsis sp.]|nr:NCS2 family permease [Amycolatopsis sp.]